MMYLSLLFFLLSLPSLCHSDAVQRNNPALHYTSVQTTKTYSTVNYTLVYQIDQSWSDGSQMFFSTMADDLNWESITWFVDIQSKIDNSTSRLYTYTQVQDQIYNYFSPPANDPSVYPNFDFTVKLGAGQNDTSDPFQTQITAQIKFAQLWLDGSSYWRNDNNPICPGFIYYYVEAPNDKSYAYNLTLEGQYWTVTFSDVWVKAGDWPSTSSYDFHFTDLSPFESVENTIVANTLYTGRWFLIFKCKIKKAATTPFWQVGAYLDPTCKRSCFDTGGTCFTNAPLPYCTCSRWYRDGTSTCNNLFEGDYTLMVLAVVFFIGIVIYITVKVRRWRAERSKEREPVDYFESIQEPQPQSIERQPLLFDQL